MIIFEFLKSCRTQNVYVGREMSDLKTAISDVLNENHYDKHKKKDFLNAMAKNNDIELPVN